MGSGCTLRERAKTNRWRRTVQGELTLLVLVSVGVSVVLVSGVLGWRDGARATPVSGFLLSLAAAFASALVGLLLARRLQRRIAGPMAALAPAARALRDGHDEVPGAGAAVDDEIGGIVADLNAVLDEIRLRDAAASERIADLEATLAKRTAALRDTVAARAAEHDLLATIRHEVRTPMSGAVGAAEMLAASELPAAQRRLAEVVARCGETLLAAIDDILDIPKLETGKPELRAASADPTELVEDVLAFFWQQARRKSLDLAAYVDPATPGLIETDPVRLRQAIGALVNNAIRLTDAGAVMVHVAPKGEGLRIAVRDTGVGIPRDEIPGLFDAPTSTDEPTVPRFGGAGLGLAICKRLAEAMGGGLVAVSDVGKGSVFALDLPMRVLAPAPAWPKVAGEGARLAVAGPATRAVLERYLLAAGFALDKGVDEPGLVITDPAALRGADRARAPVVALGDLGDTAARQLVDQGLADLALPQPLRRREIAAVLAQVAAGAPLGEALADAGRRESAPAPSFAGRRVLVAEGALVDREVAFQLLTRLGCAVKLVGDGPAAVEAAQSEPFDLVLLDVSLPQMDGRETVAAIRAGQTGAGTPIVALTDHAAGPVADRWREAGVDGMLSRPFTLAALAARLGEFMTPAAQAPASGLAPPPRPPAAASKPVTATIGPASAADLLDPQVTGELARMAAAGKGDFVARVRRLYRENAPAAVRAVIEACNARDCAAAAGAAHALKSMSLNMGARVVAETAGRLEAQARDLGVVNVDQAQILHRQLLATLDVLEGYPPDLRPPAAADAPPDEEALLADLAAAIDNDQLTLVYQPQFDREGETITGVETLVRWTHPTRGFVSPAFFIPIAERYGLIGRVTQWVLARAMRETAELGDCTISFNASAVEFADPSFVDELQILIARHGFDPRRLEIEVTETAVLAEEDEVRRNMARLHELGLKIALDDFGVGYSSLSHLRLFPFDKLKIDRAFVTGCAENVQSATLVHAVVSIGRALGMKVVAEGVETEAQRKFLKVAGVHAMQGYLFAKPEPIAALKTRLAPPSAAAPREEPEHANVA